MIFIFATGLVFRLFKVGQYAFAVLPAVAELSPAVIVVMLTANVKQPVDGAGPAQYFTCLLYTSDAADE